MEVRDDARHGLGVGVVMVHNGIWALGTTR